MPLNKTRHFDSRKTLVFVEMTIFVILQVTFFACSFNLTVQID